MKTNILLILILFFAPVAWSQEFVPEPLLWESHHPQGRQWSEYVFDLFKIELTDTLSMADDIDFFCPFYQTLTEEQKINVWGMLVSAIVRFESFYDPLARYVEPGAKVDPITQRPVVSEGLLQLSYQDFLKFSNCEFDWEQDKNLSEKDPQKTILNPFANLDCGTKILVRQIRDYRKIVIGKGAYWAVIQEKNVHQKIDRIADSVRTLSFCH